MSRDWGLLEVDAGAAGVVLLRDLPYLEARERARREEAELETQREVFEARVRAAVDVDAGKRRTGDRFFYVTPEGMAICRTHLVECARYRFRGRHLKVVRLRETPRLRRTRSMLRSPAPACAMCETYYAEGNTCHRDDCAAPLHPQWPVVYCSNACALEDR